MVIFSWLSREIKYQQIHLRIQVLEETKRPRKQRLGFCVSFRHKCHECHECGKKEELFTSPSFGLGVFVFFSHFQWNVVFKVFKKPPSQAGAQRWLESSRLFGKIDSPAIASDVPPSLSANWAKIVKWKFWSAGVLKNHHVNNVNSVNITKHWNLRGFCEHFQI